MQWLFVFVFWLVPELFGDVVGRNRPWVALLASLGCLATMLAVGASVAFFLWVLLR